MHPDGHEQALNRYAQAALLAGCTAPNVEWHRWDHADLLEAEARRGARLASALCQWVKASTLKYSFSANDQSGRRLSECVEGEVAQHAGPVGR